MKEIEIKELNKYLNPLNMEEEPAIIFASNGEEKNGMTIGWLSIGVLWRKKCATVYIHKDRFSKHIFDTADYFSICFPLNKDQIKYFGSVSGKTEDKIINSKLNMVLDVAPYASDSSLVIICKKMGQSEFDIRFVDDGVKEWYKKSGVHTQYYGEIVKVLVK